MEKKQTDSVQNRFTAYLMAAVIDQIPEKKGFDSRGSRQIDVQARLFGSLLAEISASAIWNKGTGKRRGNTYRLTLWRRTMWILMHSTTLT